MPRPPKPNYLKIINGSAKHNPDRHREDHLIPDDVGPLGDPPENLDEHLKCIWEEIVHQVHPDIIQQSDRLTLEQFCRVVHEIRTGDKFVSAQHQRYQAYAAMFGMSPADRQRVKIKEKPKGGKDDV